MTGGWRPIVFLFFPGVAEGGERVVLIECCGRRYSAEGRRGLDVSLHLVGILVRWLRAVGESAFDFFTVL